MYIALVVCCDTLARENSIPFPFDTKSKSMNGRTSEREVKKLSSSSGSASSGTFLDFRILEDAENRLYGATTMRERERVEIKRRADRPANG